MSKLDQTQRSLPTETGISRRAAITSLAGGMTMMTAGLMMAGCGGSNADSRNDALQATVHQIAADELAHVRLLRTTITGLGGTPIARPAINLNPQGLPAGNVNTFLTYARAFEDTGVSAYAGAGPQITSRTLLATAARILATEAYHAGALREQVVERGITVPSLDNLDVPPTTANPFPTDANGLAPVRTVAQVIAIVTPFFPSGINGTPTPATDVEILNFALNLEYLEAEFYSYSLTGTTGLADADVTGSGTAGTVTNAAAVNF